MNLIRLYHTIRYLQPRQIEGQILHRLRARLENPERFAAQSVPTFLGFRWRPAAYFLPPGVQVNRPGEILTGRMDFLNQSQVIGWMPDWERAGLPKLWLYNLHYFEWLWAFAGEQYMQPEDQDATGFVHARAAVLDWIERHGLSRGRMGWEPYPVSLRLMNWCTIFFERYRSQTLADDVFLKRLWASIWLQSEWLASHLEVHLLGNHLMENAAALALVGACFEGPSAARWLEMGLDLLREQVREQILADGLHFERSPMYHARIVYLLLLLYNTGHEKLQEIVGPVLPGMLEALAAMCHSDKRIALFNDSAFGIYNELQALLDYAADLGLLERSKACQSLGSWALPEAGYYGFRDAAGSYVVCDAGAIGPDYIPGHAHADTFSFELSLHGQRVIVDSGVHDYEWSDLRRYVRSTWAHNTVQIEEQEQSEVWGAFRVARRAYPRDVCWTPRSDGFTLSASHDGYKRLSGNPIHIRTISYIAGGAMTVLDRVTSTTPLKCRTILHLHPECKSEFIDNRTTVIKHPGGLFQITFTGNGQMECQEGWYCPEFYRKVKNSVLVFSWTTSEALEVSYKIEPKL